MLTIVYITTDLLLETIFDENLTDSSVSKVHPLQLGESMMRGGNKVKESNTKKPITPGVSAVICPPGYFIPNWVYLQRVGGAAREIPSRTILMYYGWVCALPRPFQGLRLQRMACPGWW